jgi:glucuronyl/N-acetylglucosaminyl transferase EXT1
MGGSDDDTLSPVAAEYRQRHHHHLVHFTGAHFTKRHIIYTAFASMIMAMIAFSLLSGYSMVVYNSVRVPSFASLSLPSFRDRPDADDSQDKVKVTVPVLQKQPATQDSVTHSRTQMHTVSLSGSQFGIESDDLCYRRFNALSDALNGDVRNAAVAGPKTTVLGTHVAPLSPEWAQQFSDEHFFPKIIHHPPLSAVGGITSADLTERVNALPSIDDKVKTNAAHTQYLSRKKLAFEFELNQVLQFEQSTTTTCNMLDCFDRSRCGKNAQQFRFFMYPMPTDTAESQSGLFKTIMGVAQHHTARTDNPNEACIFLVSLDTLFRDVASPFFVQGIEQQLRKLPHWNNGRNHVLFVSSLGTYPLFLPYMDIDIGEAMLAISSPDRRIFRRDFDIALPQLPLRGVDCPVPTKQSDDEHSKRYLASFKGTETPFDQHASFHRLAVPRVSALRTALRKLHRDDILPVALQCTRDESEKACKEQNVEYERYDHVDLTCNSEFSIVARGTQLGSSRLVEALSSKQSIPVVLADHLVLPFESIIDWSLIAVTVDERNVGRTEGILRAISPMQRVRMRQSASLMFDRYLSSYARMFDTLLVELQSRVFPSQVSVHQRLPVDAQARAHANGMRLLANSWHSGPKDDVSVSPWAERYTAVVLVYDRFDVLWNAIKESFEHSILLDKVIVHDNSCSIPSDEALQKHMPDIGVPIEVYCPPGNSLNSRFFPVPSIRTAAVYSADDDMFLHLRDADFMFMTWKHYRTSLVGLPARTHFSTPDTHQFKYDSAPDDAYSMIITGAAMFHVEHMYAYQQPKLSALREFVTEHRNCEDLLMNCVVTHLSGSAPVKVTGRWVFKCKGCKHSLAGSPANRNHGHFDTRSKCLRLFTDTFGYLPLRHRWFRSDPTKDDKLWNSNRVPSRKHGVSNFPVSNANVS